MGSPSLIKLQILEQIKMKALEATAISMQIKEVRRKTQKTEAPIKKLMKKVKLQEQLVELQPLKALKRAITVMKKSLEPEDKFATKINLYPFIL